MKSKILSLFLIVYSGCAFGQTNDPVLMKINGKPVYKSEFEYIYNKNNSNNSIDKKTLDEYVDLFVNFRLKVEEAEHLGLDTTQSFVNELSGYRSQLTKPYLTDQKVEEEILQTAYNRMKEDVDVSHILVRVPQNATATDTLNAWKKINAIAKRLEKEDFAKVAKETSEDQSAEKNGGHLGWMSAFQTVYPFETVAYSTPVGTISKPFKTAFGYHIIKVNNRRNSLGEILVAHIMRFTKEGDAAKNKAAKITIDSLYQRVLAGDDFGKLATQYSEDKASAVKNGELPWFGVGRMVPEFETAAFALKKNGDVSAPVQSAYGWHIIKLLDKRGLGSFDNIKADIERKIKRDERSTMGQKAFVAELKNEYNFQVNQESVKDFTKLLQNTNLSDSTFKSEALKLNKPLFSFAGKQYSQGDFARYLSSNSYTEKSIPSEIINDKLTAFTDREILSYEDSQLEKKYPDFRLLMQEYHDGILLFDISNTEVWEKASKDNDGLNKYFKDHKSDYKWEKPHYKGLVVSCKDEASYKAAKLIVKKSSVDSLEKYLTTRLNDSIQHVKVEKGIFVQGDNKIVDKFGFKDKKVTVPEDKNFPYQFVVGKNIKTTPEDYTDVRGLVTADYQDYLEKNWIESLRAKYPVEINKEVLKTIKEN